MRTRRRAESEVSMDERIRIEGCGTSILSEIASHIAREVGEREMRAHGVATAASDAVSQSSGWLENGGHPTRYRNARAAESVLLS